MDGWTTTLLAISAYVALRVLLRWMIVWQAQARERYWGRFSRQTNEDVAKEGETAKRAAR